MSTNTQSPQKETMGEELEKAISKLISVWGLSSDSNVDSSSAEITSVCEPNPPSTKENLLDDVKNIYKFVATRHDSQRSLMNEIRLRYERAHVQETRSIVFYDPFQNGIPTNRILSRQECNKRIEVHKDLLQAYLAFFLACQHHSATEALAALPKRYGMTNRIWRHGIHDLLKLMRNQPDSAEQILHFLNIAQATMTFLYQMVSQFEETWMECLGDLARERSAIVKNDQDSVTCAAESRLWYDKLANKTPSVGRLYCHLATISRHDAMQELFYFHLSLHVKNPFALPKDMWESLFARAQRANLHPCDAAFISIYHILFYTGSRDKLGSSTSTFLESVEKYVAEMGEDWQHIGYYIVISLATALLSTNRSNDSLRGGCSILMGTCHRVLRRKEDANILPFFHGLLIFLPFIVSEVIRTGNLNLLDLIPWQQITDLLNEVKSTLISRPGMANQEFPRPVDQSWQPLSEDAALRGLLPTIYLSRMGFSPYEREEIVTECVALDMSDIRRNRILLCADTLCANQLQDFITRNPGTEEYTVIPVEITH